jgi:hypothetical protein
MLLQHGRLTPISRRFVAKSSTHFMSKNGAEGAVFRLNLNVHSFFNELETMRFIFLLLPARPEKSLFPVTCPGMRMVRCGRSASDVAFRGLQPDGYGYPFSRG